MVCAWALALSADTQAQTTNGACAASPTVYRQNWTKGVAPVAMKANGDFYRNTQWGGTDPVDSVYPEIASSEAVTVINGAGPAGENVLDFNPAGTPYYEDYQTAGLVFGGFGPIADPAGGSRWWDATQGCLSVAYKWTTAAWNQISYAPLLALSQSLYWHGPGGLSLAADVSGNQGTFELMYTLYNPNSPTGVSWAAWNTYPFTRAATENQWQQFAVIWRNGSTDNAVSNVASDGWIHVYWNGTLIYDVNNIPLLMNANSASAADGKPNRLRTLWLGYFGLFGPVTNLVLGHDQSPGFLVMPPQNTENEPQPLREMCLNPSSWPTGWNRMTMFGNGLGWFAALNDTEMSQCFANLRNASKELGLEVNVLDTNHPSAVGSYEEWQPDLARIAQMWGNNATISLILDEPLLLGTQSGHSYADVVTQTGDFIQLARQGFPGIKINIEEAYPTWSREALAQFYSNVNGEALSRTGIGIQYASIDYDWNDPSAQTADMAVLQNEINNVDGIGFHIIFFANPGTGLSWHEALMREDLTFLSARVQGVLPQMYSIQAWYGGAYDDTTNYDPEYQFPENDLGSFTRGVRDLSLMLLPVPSLPSGGYLFPDQSVSSADGRFLLAYQSDGNLVLYNTQTSPWTPLWSSGTNNTSPGFVAMQSTDGNLVVYDGSSAPVWWSGTNSSSNAGAFLVVQSDGNLVMYSDYPYNTPLWDTETNQY